MNSPARNKLTKKKKSLLIEYYYLPYGVQIINIDYVLYVNQNIIFKEILINMSAGLAPLGIYIILYYIYSISQSMSQVTNYYFLITITKSYISTLLQVLFYFTKKLTKPEVARKRVIGE